MLYTEKYVPENNQIPNVISYSISSRFQQGVNCAVILTPSVVCEVPLVLHATSNYTVGKIY